MKSASEFFKALGCITIFAAVAFTVMRGIDYLIPAPPTKYYIFIEDKDGEHSCDEYKTDS